MSKHRGAPLWMIKKALMADFAGWCKERKTEQTPENMIEFLMQKWFVQGKKFLDYCDRIEIPFPTAFCPQGMREGFMIPTEWIGRRK